MRIRQHVNPLDVFFETFRGEKPVLDPARELEVEIGCADAQFLFERAARDPARQYVGLEIREDLVEWVNRKARTSDAPVHAVWCHAQLHVKTIFAPGVASRVYVNFPDPWFKRRHHVRRMVDTVLADQVAYLLRAGGELFVQTDVWDIALDAMRSFDGDDRFVNLAGEWTFWKHGNPYGVRSWREQNAEETDLPIWRILYRRTLPPTT
jgi:tRNA (guanine-N7-)-methyltransferase